MTIPEAVQAMPEAISDLLKKAYLQGFAVSAEGYNSEYPFNEDEAEIQSDKDWLGRRDEFLSSLALPFLAGVKVKALEWVVIPACNGVNRSETEIGNYFIGATNIVRLGLKTLSKPLPSLEAAKAAAQADYEARILSAIEVSGNPGQLTPSPRAQALESRRLWTNAQAEELAIGWTYDFSEIERICDEAAKQCGYDATLEFTEAVMKIADARFSALSSQPAAEQHTDDIAVDRFASAMKIKLKIKRAQGRGGWEDKKTVTREYLSYLLLQNCLKGSTLNVANLAMMLHQRGEEIVIDEETSSMLSAGISSQPVASKWKTIDSAPKDGTVILVYRDDVGVFTAHYVEEDAYLSSPMNPPEGDFYWFSTCGDDLTGDMPTHWRPLPASPGASE